MTITLEKTADDFEQLLQQSFSRPIEVANVVKGTILKRESEGYLVDIGSKSEAFLPNREVSNFESKDADEIVHVGEEYDFYILQNSNDDEQPIVVSLKRVSCAQIWNVLAEAKSNNDSIRVKVMNAVRGGVIVDVMELKGFIPSSHLRTSPPFDNLIGEELEVKILEADPKNNKLILSQRLALVEKRNEVIDQVISDLKPDDIINGQVIRIADFGVFVDINGVDGLLPISEISWDRIKHPSDILKTGQRLDVKILKIDYDTKRISLTLKRMQPNPWDEIKELYSEGQMVEGTVNKVTTFGVFVNIYKNIEALLPISEISDEENINIFSIYNQGDFIKAKIKKFSPDEHRIALTVK